MAGYPVQRRRPPVIMREAARRQARDSGTLSGTSAEEEQMIGKSCLLRERNTSMLQAAAYAFLLGGEGPGALPRSHLLRLDGAGLCPPTDRGA
jgi:hypothetical protein